VRERTRELRRHHSPLASTGREIDVLTLDDSASAARCPLIAPVQIGVPDDGIRRRRAPLRQVFRRMGIADQKRVIAAYECAMQCRANAHVRLCTRHDEFANAQAR
jgi:hypothetical protein